MSGGGRVLVYGGRGALGSVLVTAFKARGYWVASVGTKANEDADANCIVTSVDSWTAQEAEVLSTLSSWMADDKLDAIFCVAGGWAGGSTKSKDLVKNADLVWKQSVWSSTIAAKVAHKHLKESGLLTLTGACPCLEGTPGMIGYGMAKAAVHQLTKSLALPNKCGLPAGAVTLAILPVTLDTPMNRKWMKDADTSTWTSLEFVSDLLVGWTQSDVRPDSGSLIEIVTAEGKTTVHKVG